MFARKITARALIVVALVAATTFASFAPAPMHAQAAPARGAAPAAGAQAAPAR